MNRTIRVLVVEDSVFMQRALVRRIEEDKRFKVVDTANDGRSGVEKAARLRPDVITMDVEMPGMNGIEALKQIVARIKIPVVMVSGVTEEGARVTLEALRLGAIDFIPKSQGAEHIHQKLLAAVEASKAAKRPVRAAPVKPPVGRRTSPVATSSGSAHSSVSAPAVRKPARVPTRSVSANVVLIGSSTGGPPALQKVISQLPKNTPVPVLVAQHMPPGFTKALARQLNDASQVNVVEANDGAALVPGTVYIAPGGQHLRVSKDKKIAVCKDAGESLYKPSVDVLVDSAREVFGRNIIAVMMTGMGSDGGPAFQRLHELGGYTIAQDQASCVVWGMPRAVEEADAASEVAPLSEIPRLLRGLLRV
ncbi:MAG: chemotaxis response regulator protein-glutamate methylesterase [Filomicrobium sp.]